MMNIEDTGTTSAFWLDKGTLVLVQGQWETVENVVHHDDGTVSVEFKGNRCKFENILADTLIPYYAGI